MDRRPGRACVRGGVGGINETSVTGISLPPPHMALSGTSTALPAGGRCRTSMSLEPPEKKNDGPIACRMCGLHPPPSTVCPLLPRPVYSLVSCMQCKRKTYAAALDTTTSDLVACVLPVPAGRPSSCLAFRMGQRRQPAQRSAAPARRSLCRGPHRSSMTASEPARAGLRRTRVAGRALQHYDVPSRRRAPLSLAQIGPTQ